MPTDLSPYRVHVPDADLIDLRERLRRTRWPETATTPGWAQGVPLTWLQELCGYWAEEYSWRDVEARLNAVPQYLTRLDGLDVHVLHARSPHPGAMPLILSHGWPGSVLEYLELVPALTDPPAHGGVAEDAFDVVIPSLPGYGFSAKPATAGWGVERIAAAWAELMARLGYRRYGAAGSDWGTSISSLLGAQDGAHVVGIHLVPPLAGPDPGVSDRTDAERAALDAMAQRSASESAYSDIHRTKPQTIGYALVDSPAGLCAWMAEKYWTWSDHQGGEALSRDQILDQVTLYWLTGTAASSARLYAESIERVGGWISGASDDVVTVPTGASVFAAEVPRPSRRWAARRYPDIRFWAEHDRGGHFPALESPHLLVGDLRAFFGKLR